MNIERLNLIKNLAGKIQLEKGNKFQDLERQVVMLSDREYITLDKKVVDSVSELNFN